MFRIGVPRMRRQMAFGSLLLFGAGLLAGCGQKGPLILPPTKPVARTPAATAPSNAPASSVAAPAAPMMPMPAASVTPPAPSRSG